jgi:hypothetical protein
MESVNVEKHNLNSGTKKNLGPKMGKLMKKIKCLKEIKGLISKFLFFP